VPEVNFSAWASHVGVSKYTTCRGYHADTLPVPARRAGRLILVGSGASSEPSRTVICARVSSTDQRADLDRQIARLSSWVTAGGQAVSEMVTEVGPAVNGRRRKLGRILAEPTATQIVVKHRDRLARFCVEHLQAALAGQGWQIVILDAAEVEDDLVRDMTEVLTSFCARLYGRRRARNRALRALGCAQGAPTLAE
jgi:putative resolvase